MKSKECDIMNRMDFLVDDEKRDNSSQSEAWNILIVDDDPAVHEATKYALLGFSFWDKQIKWFDAYSAEEGKRIVQNEDEMALMFLDVVMETDNAGLAYAKWFRDEVISPATRIILRTGQPGQAPEKEIIVNYDLHDYKTKTELTSDKLFTTTVAALRAYSEMNRLETTKVGLEKIIDSTSEIFEIQSLHEYSSGVLYQLTSILDLRSNCILCAQNIEDGTWEILARRGSFGESYAEILRTIAECGKNNIFAAKNGAMLQVLSESGNTKYAIYLENAVRLSDIQLKMLLTFCSSVAIGLKNIRLYDNLLNSHRATIMALAQLTESRDKETGQHVHRIAYGAESLAKNLLDRGCYLDELDEKVVDTIGLSSTLHDIGKVAVPDIILLKPGRLTDEEFEVIKLHSEKGAEIIQTAIDAAGENTIQLTMGKRIALSHHERWDGKGYPHGLRGREIPIEARITSVIDVFDALTHHRCYKPAYSRKEAIEIIREGREINFDPLIVDSFLEICEALIIEENER